MNFRTFKVTLNIVCVSFHSWYLNNNVYWYQIFVKYFGRLSYFKVKIVFLDTQSICSSLIMNVKLSKKPTIESQIKILQHQIEICCKCKFNLLLLYTILWIFKMCLRVKHQLYWKSLITLWNLDWEHLMSYPSSLLYLVFTTNNCSLLEPNALMSFQKSSWSFHFVNIFPST